MRILYTILFCLLAFFIKAQTTTTITYTPMTAGGYAFKYLKADSGLAVPFRNLTTGRGVVRPGVIVADVADSLLKYFNGVTWVTIGSGSGSSGIFVDSNSIVGNNLFYWKGGVGTGIQINKLDSVAQKAGTDSIFTYIAGVPTFAYRNLSAGSGSVTQVTSSTSDITITNPTTTPELTLDTAKHHSYAYLQTQFATLAHTHDASAIVSGTLPIARGGTGLSGIGSVAQQIRVNALGTALEYFTPTTASGSDSAFVRHANINDTTLRLYRFNGDSSDVLFTLEGLGGGGAGTVTSFSSGNLSPLFTTSVATATSTPTLSYTLSNAAAYTNFGNRTASSAAPTYFVNPFIDSMRRNLGSLSVEGRINGSWVYQFADSTGGAAGWALTGNSATNASTNFVGTRDSTVLNFRTNNIVKMSIERAASNILKVGDHSGGVNTGYISIRPTNQDIQFFSVGAYDNLLKPEVLALSYQTSLGVLKNFMGESAIFNSIYPAAQYGGLTIKGNAYVSGSSIIFQNTFDANPTRMIIHSNANLEAPITMLPTGGSLIVGGGVADTTSVALARFKSTTKGVFLTRMTKTQRNAITTGIIAGTTVGGSGYTNGNQNNIAFTGGTGTGAIGSFLVSSGIVQGPPVFVSRGINYAIGDVLTAAIPGGSGYTFTITSLTGSLAEGLTVFVTDNGGYLSWFYGSAWNKVSSVTD